MVEHQPRRLLVGVVERHRPVARIVRRTRGSRRHRVTVLVVPHVRHVLDADALGVAGGLAGRGRPLVRGPVTDPRGVAAVQVKGRPVLGVQRAVRPLARAHRGGVHRQEEVAAGARGQLVDELDPDRVVLLRDDERAEEVDRRDVDRLAGRVPLHLAGGVGRLLDVATQQSGRQVGVQLLGVLPDRDHVVVRPWEGRRVRHRDRDVLAEVVGVGLAQAGQGVHELADAGPRHDRAGGGVELGQRAVGVVRDGAVVVRRVARVQHRIGGRLGGDRAVHAARHDRRGGLQASRRERRRHGAAREARGGDLGCPAERGVAALSRAGARPATGAPRAAGGVRDGVRGVLADRHLGQLGAAVAQDALRGDVQALLLGLVGRSLAHRRGDPLLDHLAWIHRGAGATHLHPVHATGLGAGGPGGVECVGCRAGRLRCDRHAHLHDSHGHESQGRHGAHHTSFHWVPSCLAY